MIEHTHDLTNANWFKSSYSAGEGNCVEVATNLTTIVPVRDSKDLTAGTVVFAHAAWSAFTASPLV